MTLVPGYLLKVTNHVRDTVQVMGLPYFPRHSLPATLDADVQPE